MTEKKALSPNQLAGIVGGNDVTAFVDVRCIITYVFSGEEHTEDVILKVGTVNGNVCSVDVAESIAIWCSSHYYEYVSHSIIQNDGYFVV